MSAGSTSSPSARTALRFPAIRAARKAAGLGLSTAAAALGISISTLSAWERDGVNLGRAHRLAALYGDPQLANQFFVSQESREPTLSGRRTPERPHAAANRARATLSQTRQPQCL